MKFLVTDDSKMARKMVIRELKKFISEDSEILQASNGQEAVEAYWEHKPKLCFMDLTMPVMDGFQATLEISEFDSNAKILIVSADVQKGAVQRAKENGALDFIKKPINSEKMKDILTEFGLI